MFLIPTWFLISFTAGLTSSGYNFLNRFILKGRDDPTVYAWYTELTRVLVFGTLAVFDWHIILTPYSIMLFLLLGLTEFIGAYWYMKMHFYSELSLSSILSRTRLIWVPIVGFFLLGEKLFLLDYVGILVIFLGVSITIAPKKLLIDKGALYANLSAFMIALNIVIAKMLIPFASPIVINLALALPSVFLFPLFMKNSQTRISNGLKTHIALKTFAALISIIQIYLFVVALQYGDASKVNAVYQSMMIFAVIAGIIFLKERERIVQKLIGATVTIIGVVLLGFSW